jgi:hypothetical protein
MLYIKGVGWAVEILYRPDGLFPFLIISDALSVQAVIA